jgi:putative hydrolase of the HAD superfamily
VIEAVIFDLWDTLVEFPADEGTALMNDLAELVPVGAQEFEQRLRDGYRASMTGPLADAYRSLGVPDEHLERHLAARHAFTRKALRPREGALETLAALRERGIKVAMMSVCSEDVPAVWPETSFAGLFDAETFSSECGLIKPEPAIYLHTAALVDVEPGRCMFVGDGANDELAGAERVGMTAVLFLPRGRKPHWPEVAAWTGLRVSSLREVLQLC